MTRGVHILNASFLEHQELTGIADLAREIFRLPVALEAAELELQKAFDRSRGQYHSTALLSQLLGTYRSPTEKYIAVVDVDLYIPVLTFVFGEAQFDGTASIVSVHRLTNQFYGMPPDQERLVQRLEKEIIHELGHTFGLFHCHQFECVMRSSTYVEEIDLKLPGPCRSCRELLGHKQSLQNHEHST